MASFEYLSSIEPWTFLSDSFLSDASARETETLTKALQQSLYNSTTVDPFLDPIQSETTWTPTISSVSGSDAETAPAKRQPKSSTSIPVSSPKITKRKTRASKKSQTTFITADPANFRHMVQQVTGVKFGHSSAATIVKPEPQRIGVRLQQQQRCLLPTLDTSAFWLDNQQQEEQLVASSGHSDSIVSDFDYEAFPSFTTLESWKVM